MISIISIRSHVSFFLYVFSFWPCRVEEGVPGTIFGVRDRLNSTTDAVIQPTDFQVFSSFSSASYLFIYLFLLLLFKSN